MFTIDRKVSIVIKITSTLLISSAIGLEIWKVAAELTHSKLPDLPSSLFMISRLAITIHAIEGVIAAIYTPNKDKVLQEGIYTFFVGTLGLLEIHHRNLNWKDE
jgi:hypothetical protein